jgi:hypothetical protein
VLSGVRPRRRSPQQQARRAGSRLGHFQPTLLTPPVANGPTASDASPEFADESCAMSLADLTRGALIGAATLVDVVADSDSPWAEKNRLQLAHRGRTAVARTGPVPRQFGFFQSPELAAERHAR